MEKFKFDRRKIFEPSDFGIVESYSLEYKVQDLEVIVNYFLESGILDEIKLNTIQSEILKTSCEKTLESISFQIPLSIFLYKKKLKNIW